MRLMKIVIPIFLIVLASSSALFCEDEPRISKILDVQGTVEVKIGPTAWAPAEIGMILNQGDLIRTKAGSWAVLNLDGVGETATVEVKENSELKLAQLIANQKEETQKTLLDLALGEVLIKAKKLHSEKSKFEVKTPTSIVGVRGTTFSVAVSAAEE